jgi:hypothetical protein
MCKWVMFVQSLIGSRNADAAVIATTYTRELLLATEAPELIRLFITFLIGVRTIKDLAIQSYNILRILNNQKQKTMNQNT